MTWKALFQEHVKILDDRLSKICSDLGIDSIVFGSGSNKYYFEDDQTVPFRSNHHFAHWCPHPGEGHLLQLEPGKKPKLIAYLPDDFWHEHKTIENDFWTDAFEIQVVAEIDDAWAQISKQGRIVYHGPDTIKAEAIGLETDTEQLLPRLNWYRSYKTPYEVACIVEANRIAAKGHEAAEASFFAGGSELDIHYAYLQAVRALDRQLPYEGIVCLNEKCAVLHYHEKRDDVRDGMSMLIDSGVNYQGYASDITRTYASKKAPQQFHELLKSAQTMQLDLAKMVKAGLSMADVHYESHMQIAKILLQHGILKNISAEESVKEDLTSTFYPHGVGHMLGIFVHDVAGQQADETGRKCETDPRFPKLRSTRKLESGHVVTIEPGIYFIDTLLQKQTDDKFKSHFNWELIELLKPCGGIRIEDNVLVTENAPRNITREFLGHGKF